MFLEMGFQYAFGGRWRSTRYEKLIGIDEIVKAGRPRGRWVTKMNGKLKGLRLSRSKKFNWKAFSLVISPRRIAEVYVDVVSRMKMDDICPAIVFSGQWGLPVLSHSHVKVY
ncbi:TRNA-specific 2-thiouridylase [Actinidia chinensis var. chinensis]|uniref:tRNA-specific 2-thiouridylase n=2 Tax=Actinidia TaxID=3624 RepID=A0A2R6QIJ9_ACTCC|nr:TRNA-specific 2-thiouridylase [Actinidia chinensis var. chinensis]